MLYNETHGNRPDNDRRNRAARDEGRARGEDHRFRLRGDRWRGRPASANAHHAAKTRFILKHQPNLAPPHFFWYQQGIQRLGEFFSQSSWISGSLFGWRVSGATLRQPCRARSRYATEAATGRPNRCAKAARKTDMTNTPPRSACSAQGARNARSSSTLVSTFRRPPCCLGTGQPLRRRSRNRACSRGAVARPTPSRDAVCSGAVRSQDRAQDMCQSRQDGFSGRTGEPSILHQAPPAIPSRARIWFATLPKPSERSTKRRSAYYG